MALTPGMAYRSPRPIGPQGLVTEATPPPRNGVGTGLQSDKTQGVAPTRPRVSPFTSPFPKDGPGLGEVVPEADKGGGGLVEARVEGIDLVVAFLFTSQGIGERVSCKFGIKYPGSLLYSIL